MPDHSRLDGAANTFGALALVVADEMADATASAAGRSDSAPAALAALLHFLDHPSVDRLAESGLIERGPGADGRTTAVSLTAAGRAVAEEICAARAAVLDKALAPLSAAERAEYSRLIAPGPFGYWVVLTLPLSALPGHWDHCERSGVGSLCC